MFFLFFYKLLVSCLWCDPDCTRIFVRNSWEWWSVVRWSGDIQSASLTGEHPRLLHCSPLLSWASVSVTSSQQYIVSSVLSVLHNIEYNKSEINQINFPFSSSSWRHYYQLFKRQADWSFSLWVSQSVSQCMMWSENIQPSLFIFTLLTLQCDRAAQGGNIITDQWSPN